MSASTIPTFRPLRASAMARLADSVDLPTPPLPLATAMIRCCTRSLVCATRTLAMPGAVEAAAFTSASSASRAAGGRPVTSRMMLAESPVTRTVARPAAMGPSSASSAAAEFDADAMACDVTLERRVTTVKRKAAPYKG